MTPLQVAFNLDHNLVNNNDGTIHEFHIRDIKDALLDKELLQEIGLKYSLGKPITMRLVTKLKREATALENLAILKVYRINSRKQEKMMNSIPFYTYQEATAYRIETLPEAKPRQFTYKRGDNSFYFEISY